MSAASMVDRTESPTMDTRVPIFLHVPKAAGRSLLSVMRDNYGADRLHEIYGEPPSLAEDEFHRMSERERLAFDAVAGHLRFGLHEYIPRPSRYLTVLRDPIERVLSTYAFVRRKKSHHRHEEVVGRDLSIVEVIESRLLPMLDNGQTRALSGVGADVERCTASMLEQAKANIERHFAVVGLLERFDETLVMCQREFGRKKVRMRQRNAAPQRRSPRALDPDTRRAIAECNELDEELYRWAEHRFERQVAAGGSSFRRQVRRLRHETALRDLAVRGRALLPRPAFTRKGR
jgi:hypothetical protein